MARIPAPGFGDFSMVSVKHHEGSTVFSYEGESALPLESLKEPVSRLILSIQEEVDRQGGIVGHIKAFAEDEGASLVFSSTGDEVNVIPGKLRTTKLHIAAIVFVSDDAPIVELMEEILSVL